MIDRFELLMNKSAQHYEVGNYRVALKLTERALEIRDTAEAWLCKANCLDHLEKPDEAGVAAEIACDIEPHNCRVVGLAAGVLTRTGLGELARVKLTRALDHPDDWAHGAMWAMGRSYRDDGFWFEAKPWLKEAEKLAPEQIRLDIRREFNMLQGQLN